MLKKKNSDKPEEQDGQMALTTNRLFYSTKPFYWILDTLKIWRRHVWEFGTKEPDGPSNPALYCEKHHESVDSNLIVSMF